MGMTGVLLVLLGMIIGAFVTSLFERNKEFLDDPTMQYKCACGLVGDCICGQYPRI